MTDEARSQQHQHDVLQAHRYKSRTRHVLRNNVTIRHNKCYRTKHEADTISISKLDPIHERYHQSSPLCADHNNR